MNIKLYPINILFYEILSYNEITYYFLSFIGLLILSFYIDPCERNPCEKRQRCVSFEEENKFDCKGVEPIEKSFS